MQTKTCFTIWVAHEWLWAYDSEVISKQCLWRETAKHVIFSVSMGESPRLVHRSRLDRRDQLDQKYWGGGGGGVSINNSFPIPRIPMSDSWTYNFCKFWNYERTLQWGVTVQVLALPRGSRMLLAKKSDVDKWPGRRHQNLRWFSAGREISATTILSVPESNQ